MWAAALNTMASHGPAVPPRRLPDFKDIGSKGRSWIKVLVQPDNPADMYGREWDWVRTQIAPDIRP
jgi:hypothetical protein